MMYWPKPHELGFLLSQRAVREGREIIQADILAVDRCWRGSVPDEYIPHTKTYHLEEIDQAARDRLLRAPDRIEIPEVMMLGNAHLAVTAGVHQFVLLREMADLGYLQQLPFALQPWDAEKFRFYFRSRDQTPLVEQPVLSLYEVA